MSVHIALQIVCQVLLFTFVLYGTKIVCVSDKGDSSRHRARVFALLILLNYFILALLTTAQYNEPDNEGVILAMRLLILLSILFVPFLFYTFILENANVLVQAQTGNKHKAAPKWYKNLWVALFTLHGFVEIICIIVSIGIRTLYGIYIYYHFLNGLSLITCIVSIINLIKFRKYLIINKAKALEHRINEESISRLTHARIRTDIIIFLFFLGVCGAIYWEYIIISTESEISWANDTFYQTPILNDNMAYMEHFGSAILLACVLIVWLNVPIDCKHYQLSQNSLLFNVIICLMNTFPCFETYIMNKTNYKEQTTKKKNKRAKKKLGTTIKNTTDNNNSNNNTRNTKNDNGGFGGSSNNNDKNNNNNNDDDDGDELPEINPRTSVLIDDIVRNMSIDASNNNFKYDSSNRQQAIGTKTPSNDSPGFVNIPITVKEEEEEPNDDAANVLTSIELNQVNHKEKNDDNDIDNMASPDSENLNDLNDLIDEIVNNRKDIDLSKVDINVETHEYEVEMDGMRMISYSPMNGQSHDVAAGHDELSEDENDANLDMGDFKLALFASNYIASEDGENDGNNDGLNDENESTLGMGTSGLVNSVISINDKERNLDLFDYLSNSANNVTSNNGSSSNNNNNKDKNGVNKSNAVFHKDISLNKITFDGKLKGKRNRNKVRKIDIKIMDRNSIVQSQQTFVALRGGRERHFSLSLTPHDLSAAPSSRGGRGHSIISPFQQKGRNRMSTLRHGFSTADDNGANDGLVILSPFSPETTILTIDEDKQYNENESGNDNGNETENEVSTNGKENNNNNKNVNNNNNNTGNKFPKTNFLQSPTSNLGSFQYSSVNSHDQSKPKVSLIIYELADVLLTNTSKFDKITHATSLSLVKDKQIELSFGGKERLDALKKHFENTNINKRKLFSGDNINGNGNGNGKNGMLAENSPNNSNQDNLNNTKASVIAFVSARHHDTTLGFEILKRADLHKYFVTEKEIKWGNKIIKKNLSHVIGKQHRLRDGLQYEYLLILKLLYVLQMDHENALYVGHRKDIIEHLISINACHTFYVQSNGMTQDDFDCIESMYDFEPVF